MNQKIIIITLGVLCGIGLIFVVILVFSNNSNTTPPVVQMPNSYILSMSDTNDALSATINVAGQITQLDETGISKYTLTSFNSPHDILWAECPPDTYTTSNATSTQGNSIINDPIIGPGISINEGTANNLTFMCTKIQNTK